MDSRTYRQHYYGNSKAGSPLTGDDGSPLPEETEGEEGKLEGIGRLG